MGLVQLSNFKNDPAKLCIAVHTLRYKLEMPCCTRQCSRDGMTIFFYDTDTTIRLVLSVRSKPNSTSDEISNVIHMRRENVSSYTTL